MQAGPALQPGPASPNGAPQIVLRRSVALRGATIAFILIAVAAVQASLAARLGGMQAAPATLAVLGALLLGASRHWRAEPAAIKIGPDGLIVWNRAGQTLAQGRIAGCSQWSGRLLILALAGAGGASRTVLIAADTLGAEAFRELAVLGRCASRV
ncbi:hypothetical protein SAMN05216466_104214 [Paraburkholderia phenazinium]|jgi:hypothetical protein|uniref:Uncharacterized protein n=2 Tax=Paraburkholderia phenazinium TaxID=60549 RepID=A0A1G7VSZ7_9BURK|nr:hypothetical protein [Paraburkholderia phenazinium]SDG62668.1 hypothetical protein SAMN05216466_104214 [Paraburkholderia phenazinium]